MRVIITEVVRNDTVTIMDFPHRIRAKLEKVKTTTKILLNGINSSFETTALVEAIRKENHT